MNFFLLSLFLFLDTSILASSWQQLGSTISADQADVASFGSIVDLSHDGKRIAVGAPEFGNGDGSVFVYELNEGATMWNLLATIPGASGEGLGEFLSLSPDGLMVAVRRHHAPPTVVQVYQVSSNATFYQIGNDVPCQIEGQSIALDQATYRARFGSDYYLLVSGESYDNQRGMVQAYELQDSKSGNAQWKSYLTQLEGLNAGDRFGAATAFVNAPSSLFASGRVFRVAVGSPGYNNNQGMVQVFNADKDAGWSQLGADLTGAKVGESFGASIDMSDTEQPYLVIGAPEYRPMDEFNPRGKVDLYHWRSVAFGAPSSWQVVGSPLTGLKENDHFGHSVAVSQDGGRIAASSVKHGRYTGYVSVYDRDTYNSLRAVYAPFHGEQQWDEWGTSLAISRQGSVIVSGSPGLAGSVRAFIDDSPFCQVPASTTSEGTTIDSYLDRLTCRSGVALVSDEVTCAETLLFMSGAFVPCSWVSNPFSETASPGSGPSAGPRTRSSATPTSFPSTPAPTAPPSFDPFGAAPTSKPATPFPTFGPTGIRSLPSSSPSFGGTSGAPSELPSNKLSWSPSDPQTMAPSLMPSGSPIKSSSESPSSLPSKSPFEDYVSSPPTISSNKLPTATSPSPEPRGEETPEPTISNPSPAPESAGEATLDPTNSKPEHLSGPTSLPSVSGQEPTTFPWADGGLVRACRCDELGRCTSQPLPEGSNLQVCVDDPSAGANIVGINEFRLEQVELSISVVDDGRSVASNVVQHCSSGKCLVRTPVGPDLFGANRPDHLVVVGEVVVSLNGKRNLRRTGRQLSRTLQFHTIVELDHKVTKESTVEDENDDRSGGFPSWLFWLLLAILLIVVLVIFGGCTRRRILKRG